METARPLNSNGEENDKAEVGQPAFCVSLVAYREKMKVVLKDVYRYMSESSLFILHKDTAIRKFLIRLTIKKVRKKRKNLFEKDKMI